MAWALMESKIHNARSRKAARALLRRAVALNPERHSDILKWRVFLDWKEAGEAAVEAVRSALSSGEAAVSSASPVASSTSSPTAAAATAAATSSALGGGGDAGSRLRQCVSGSSERGSASSCGGSSLSATATAYSGGIAVPATAEAAAAVAEAAAAAAVRVGVPEVAGGRAAGAAAVVAENVDVSSSSLSWTRVAESAEGRRSRIRAEKKERSLATDLLALCKTVGDDYTAEHEASTALGMCKVARQKVMAKHEVRFEELAGELERTGKGLIDGSAGRGRELSGSWRLVFTTCTTCDRILLRAGASLFPPSYDYYGHAWHYTPPPLPPPLRPVGMRFYTNPPPKPRSQTIDVLRDPFLRLNIFFVHGVVDVFTNRQD